MKYRKIVMLCIIIASSTLFVEFTYKKSAGAHPGSTGAPGDNTCAKSSCHVGTPITYNDTAINKLIFSQPDSTYVPGQTYTITVRTQNAGIQRFGFELQALEDSTSKEVGTIIITDAVRTHTLTHSVLGNSRTSATHSTTGTTAVVTGFNEWTFDWMAPPVNEGDITFYYATNSTNNNNAPTGDKVFISIFKIRPSPFININEYVDEQSINAFYDQEANQIILNYYLKTAKKISVRVFDSMGREVAKQTIRSQSSGQQKEELALRGGLSKGIYYVNLSVGNRSVSKKIIIN
jgi:hypothetical protein